MANRHCGKLSKGYRQRVGLAQALLHDPEVLILDEPTAGLDPKQIIETRDLIRSLGGNHTIVLSTHILPEVAHTCTRVIIINKGRVVAVDTPDNLTHQLKGAATLYVQIEGDDRTAEVLKAIPGVTQVSVADQHERFVGFEIESEADRDVRRDVAQTVVSNGWGLLELRPTRLSLEEIFLQLTTEESAQADAPPPAEPPQPEEATHG
jgi:ABC-2 type transport system ATP-binding protein